MLKKTDKILYILTAAFFILFMLSFTKSCSSTDKRETIKTALVNPKYENSITSIQLCNSQNCIFLTKQGNFWTVSENDNQNTVPASAQMVEKLIKDLITVRNMYKLSDKITNKNDFGLTDENSFVLKYNFQDGFHTIVFGNQDFSQTNRYLMTDKNTQIYEVDSSFEKYLTTSLQNWSEPFIISQQILGKITADDVQNIDASKLLELRHGGLSPLQNSDLQGRLSPLSKLTLELGNKNHINLDIYELTDETYSVVTKYYKSTSTYPIYSSNMKISSWTYNQLITSTTF